MKKIMKKALSLMLALVMMFSLAPMTASAATGDSETPAQLVVDGSVLTSEYTAGGDAYFYTYTPSTNGTLTLKAEGEDVYVTIQGGNVYNCIDYNPTMGYETEIVEVVLTAGTTYNIVAMTSSFATGTVKFSATYEEGAASAGPNGDSVDNAIDTTNSSLISVPARSTKYFYITGMYSYGQEYTLTVNGGAAAGMNGGVNIATYFNGQQVATATGDTAASALAVGMMANGGSIYFSVTNSGNFDCEYMISVTDGAPSTGGPGSYEEPVELELGDQNVTLNDNEYWYTWTAEEAGTFTLTMNNMLSANGWTYMFDNSAPYSTGWDEYDKNVCEVTVVAGQEVLFSISVPYWVEEYEVYDPYTAGTGTIYFSTSFTPGVVGDDDNDDNNDDNNNDNTPTEGVITPGEGDANYAESTAPILVGDNTLTVSNDYPYTVFVFTPVSEGSYTFTSEDSLIGIVSYHDMWVQNEPNAENVSAHEFEWECNGVGQSIMVAVLADTNVANIKVVWEELEVEEIPTINAYPTVSLETYTFDGDLDKLESLMYGLADEKIDFALGEDGFFHVVDIKDFDENGDYIGKKPLEELPVVLVKLNDSVVSLQSAIGYGNVKYVEYGEDEDGNPVALSILYFNDMLTEYLSYAATDAKLYPLTEDLLYTMILVGADQGWYVEDGAVQYAFANDGISEDWLFTFAMYYLNQDVVTLDKEEPVVDKEAMTDIIASNQAGKDTVINTTTKNEAGEEVTIKFEFAAGTMKPVDGKTEYTFEVSLVEKIDDATAEKAEIKKDTFVLGVSFEYDGKLPAKATITIPVPAAFANMTLYYYEVLADGTLKYVCDAPVDANGNAKVTQDHCSDYVLLSEKIVEELPEAPKTGDTTNFALWIAVLGLGVVAMAGSVVMKKREF